MEVATTGTRGGGRQFRSFAPMFECPKNTPKLKKPCSLSTDRAKTMRADSSEIKIRDQGNREFTTAQGTVGRGWDVRDVDSRMLTSDGEIGLLFDDRGKWQRQDPVRSWRTPHLIFERSETGVNTLQTTSTVGHESLREVGFQESFVSLWAAIDPMLKACLPARFRWQSAEYIKKVEWCCWKTVLRDDEDGGKDGKPWEVGGVYIASWSRGMTVANKHPFREIANCAPEIANHFCHFPFFGNDPLFVRPFPFCLRCGATFGAFTGTFWSLLCGTLSSYVSNFSGHVRLSISFLLGSDLTVVVALSIVFTGRMRGCRLSSR